MKTNEKLHKLDYVFSKTFNSTDFGAFVSLDGLSYFVKPLTISDTLSLQFSASNTYKYLNLKPGEIAFTNDPYSGGTQLTSYTFVMGISLSQKKETEILLCLRYYLKPGINFTETIDKEGIRIPPTPIYDGKKILSEVFNSLKSSSLIPFELINTIPIAIAKLEKMKKEFCERLEIHDLQINKTLLQNYLSESYERAKKFVSELPHGEIKTKKTFFNNGVLNIKITHNQKQITFDFEESQFPSLMQITSTSVFGACFIAFRRMCEHQFPINSGTFQIIETRISSKQKFLDSKFPSPTFFGINYGSPLIANTVTEALSQWMPNRAITDSQINHCQIEIQFTSGKTFYDLVVGGSGGSKHKPGTDGVDFWNFTFLEPSIEDLEKIFPLEISKYSIREQSGGHGQKSGGNGLLKSYILKEDALVTWCGGIESHAQGKEGGNPGLDSKIVLQIPGEKRKNLPTYGEMLLPKNSVITLISGGGGAYGYESKSHKNTA